MLAELEFVVEGGEVGGAAEELIFGENEITSGAYSDLQRETNLSRAMVTNYDISNELGLASHDYNNDGRSVSSETRLLIENKVKRFLERAYNNARNILSAKSRELQALAEALLEHETHTGKQIKNLISQLKYKQQQVAASPNILQPSLATSYPAAAAAAAATAKAKGMAPVGS